MFQVIVILHLFPFDIDHSKLQPTYPPSAGCVSVLFYFIDICATKTLQEITYYTCMSCICQFLFNGSSLVLGVLYQSVAGSVLSVVVHSLLLMPLETVKPLLPSFLALLPSIDKLNKALPAAALLEEQELEWPVQGEIV